MGFLKCNLCMDCHSLNGWTEHLEFHPRHSIPVQSYTVQAGLGGGMGIPSCSLNPQGQVALPNSRYSVQVHKTDIILRVLKSEESAHGSNT